MRAYGFLLAGLTALTGCGSSERTAGGSSYETENALAIRVLRPDGTPASGVDVRTRPLRWIEGESYDASLDLRSDSTGTIRLNLPSGAWRLEARQGGMFAIRDVPASGRVSDLGSLRLGPPALLQGRSRPGARIGIGGLHRSAVADAAGYFHIDSVPAGVHMLRRIGSAERAFVQVGAGRSIDAGLLRADSANEIFLEDFEDGDARHRFGPWTDGGWWRVAATAGVNLSPDSTNHQPARAVFADGEGGKVFHVSAAFPAQATAFAWARCGVDFGPRPVDLSNLVAVRFRARGIGSATVLLDIDSVGNPDAPRATVTLEQDWRDFEIPAADLRVPSAPAAGPDRLRRAVGLTWSLSASGDIWLDDIRLAGPSPALLWGPASPP